MYEEQTKTFTKMGKDMTQGDVIKIYKYAWENSIVHGNTGNY